MEVSDLVVLNYAWMCAKARKMCFDTADAEDLISDTVLRILENSGRFDGVRDVRPWAQTVMYNLFRTRINRRKCVDFTPLIGDEYPMVVTPEDEMGAGIIREILERLADDFVSVRCVRMYADGYTVSEIAGMMDVLPGTIRCRLFAGRKRIRETLELAGINVTKC